MDRFFVQMSPFLFIMAGCCSRAHTAEKRKEKKSWENNACGEPPTLTMMTDIRQATIEIWSQWQLVFSPGCIRASCWTTWFLLQPSTGLVFRGPAAAYHVWCVAEPCMQLFTKQPAHLSWAHAKRISSGPFVAVSSHLPALHPSPPLFTSTS